MPTHIQLKVAKIKKILPKLDVPQPVARVGPYHLEVKVNKPGTTATAGTRAGTRASGRAGGRAGEV